MAEPAAFASVALRIAAQAVTEKSACRWFDSAPGHHIFNNFGSLRFLGDAYCNVAVIGSMTPAAGATAIHFFFSAFDLFAGFRAGFFAETLIASGALNVAASSEPRVALPALYECLPVPASCPRSTIRYSLRIGRLSK